MRLNKPQMLFRANLPNMRGGAKLIWGRGTGKSAGISLLMDYIIKKMPRSSWGIQAMTYKHALTSTLPATLAALSMLGYKRDVHYFVGRRPPQKWIDNGWEPPYQDPLDPSNYIFTLSGAGFKIMSQDREDMARGGNLDGLIIDEGLTIDKEKFDRTATQTNRGNNKVFPGVKIHHKQFWFSSMPYGQQSNFLVEPADLLSTATFNFREKINQRIDLQLQFLDEYRKKGKPLEVWNEILELDKQFNWGLNKNGLFYSEANAFDNLFNLDLDYLLDLQDTMIHSLFMIEIMNKRVLNSGDTFYPQLSVPGKHGYKDHWSLDIDLADYKFNHQKKLTAEDDFDCNTNEPLILGVDWGGRFNCMIVAQENKKINQLNILKNMYVKPPKMLDHLFNEFAEYYKGHKEKTIYMYYDKSGNKTEANATITYAQQASKILQSKGWRVLLMSRGAEVSHKSKFILINNILIERELKYPVLRFNEDNCKELISCMNNTPVEDTARGIRKNKSSEKSKTIPQEEATHLTDAFDCIITGKFMFID